MSDKTIFDGAPGPNAPAIKAAAITPDTNADLPGGTCRGVYVGGAGTVVAILGGDESAVTFSAVPAGCVLPIRARRILATSTATLMIALY
jgi:hypothetical protein